MAQSAIPGLDVYEDPRMSGGTARPSPEARAYQDLRSANMGPQPQPTQPDPMRGVRGRAQSFVGSIAGAGDAAERMGRVAGDATKAAGMRAGSIAQSAGTLAGAAVKGVAKNALKSGPLSVATEVAPHAGFYSGSGAPAADVAKVGIRDAMAAAGGFGGAALGAKAGAGFGAAFGPWGAGIGGVIGGLAGGYYGARGGGSAGSALTGSDDVLRKHGFDPNRSVVDMAADFAQGKSAEQVASPTLRVGQEQRFPPAAPEDIPTALPPGAFPPNTQGQPGGTVPGSAAPVAPTIRRVGNAFTDGSDPGALSRVTVMSRDPQADAREANARRINGEMAQTQRELDAYGPGGTPGMSGIGGGTLVSSLRDQHFSTPSASILTPGRGNMKPRDVRHAQSLATEREIAGMRERGEMGRAQMNSATQQAIAGRQIDMGLRSQDQQFALGREGHAVQREGHILTNDNNRRRLTYDMGKDQRDTAYARSDKDFEQRAARETQLQKNIEAAHTVMTDKGPQVDVQGAAEYRRGIDRSMARMGIKGVHEIGPQAEQQLFAASDLLKTMRQNAGMLPWNPDKLKTIDPYDLTALKVMPNGDRVVTRPGQAQGQVIPGRFFRTEEGARLFGGTPTNKYDMLSGAQ